MAPSHMCLKCIAADITGVITVEAAPRPCHYRYVEQPERPCVHSDVKLGHFSLCILLVVLESP